MCSALNVVLTTFSNIVGGVRVCVCMCTCVATGGAAAQAPTSPPSPPNIFSAAVKRNKAMVVFSVAFFRLASGNKVTFRRALWNYLLGPKSLFFWGHSIPDYYKV